MNKTFFARFALPILMVVFFVIPWGLRGARMAFSTMKNDVKDWLPADYEETKDLEWFRDNFLGEQFILVTWPGASKDDTRFQLLVDKLRNELHTDPPAEAGEKAANPDDQNAAPNPQLAADDDAEARVLRERERVRQMGDRLGLTTTGDYHENWGGRNERWLLGDMTRDNVKRDQWYFITPEGELYQWDGGNNLLGWAGRRLERLFTGKNTASGELVAQVGEKPAPGKQNEYYTDPRKLTARFFKTVTTGPEVFERMIADGRISPELAIERLTGSLFGPPSEAELLEMKNTGEVSIDNRQTCMIVTLSEVGRRDLKRVLGRPIMGKPAGRLLQIASEAGLSYEDMRLGGPPVDNVAIDEEGSITLVRLIGWSLLVGVGLAYLSFRSLKITFMIFFVGGVSAILSLSFVWFANDFVDAIVMSMPSLVYVLGLTGAVHMLTYYRHHATEHGLEGAAESTIVHTWRPLLIAQFTSALGLLSLLTSELLPIRKFGFYSALGTLATLLVLYLYLPSALQLWPPGYHKKNRREGEQEEGLEAWLDRLTGNFWEVWSGYIVRNYYWVAPTVAVIVVFVGYGATKLKTNVHLLKMFDKDAKIIQDYAWLEENLGRLVPMELVVRVTPEVTAPLQVTEADEDAEADEAPAAAQAPGDPAKRLVQYNFLERMELAHFVQQAVEREFGPPPGMENAANRDTVLGRALSAVTFAPELPEPAAPGGFGKGLRRSTTNRKLEEYREEFLHSDYLRIDEDPEHAGSELWRISLRLGALNDVDYGVFVNDLKSVVEPVMIAARHREAVLRTIAADRKGQSLNGAKVAVIGLSEPGAPDEEGTGEAEKANDNMAAQPKIRRVAHAAQGQQQNGQKPSYAQEQERLFAQTFADLMLNRGFRTSSRAKSQLHFIDQQLIDEENLSGEELAARLADYDCVVLAKELSGFDLDFVQKHARHVVDARDFQFDPFSEQKTAAQRDDAVQAIYTGVVPVVYKAQRSLLNSLVDSTKYAFVSIALCLMVVMRRGPLRPWNFMNPRAGFIAMFPNMFPLAMVFGAIGWLGIEVDIGSMMTASIAIGVAVDDTIHYVEWFRKGMEEGLTRHQAIVKAYRHCGPAIIETMLIGGLGLSVFAFSTFTPTQRFGTMMLTMLVTGALGELTWMPALLASPLGKYFEPRLDHHRQTPAATSESPQPAPAAATATSTNGEGEGRMHLEPPHASRSTALRRDKAH